MKKAVLAVMLMVLASACQKMSEETLESGSKELSFHVGFEVEQESVSSRIAVSDYITSLKVYDYVNGTLKKEITQTSEDTDFGKVTLDAAYGTHELIFIGHNSETCTYNNSTSLVSLDKVMDTFSAYQTITIDAETETEQSVTLERQVAGIKLVANDAIPEGASSIEILISGYSESLDPKTGNGSEGTEYTRKWSYSNSHIGQTGTSYTVYSFVPSENHTVSVTITVKDSSSEEIVKHTLSDIPIEKNRMTVITGDLFSSKIEATLTLNGEWGDDIEIEMS